jgi:glycosyltransferase involved in cell wall biosynthesis
MAPTDKPAPKVSVVVPNYNHARFLRQRLDTILAQTFQDFELILLDDCSTDDSRSVLSSYSSDPHVSAVAFNEKNSGTTYKQWNKGVSLARGEYVWLAESDDYSDPRFLARLVAVLDAHPKVQFVFCRSYSTTEDGRPDGFGDARFLGYDQDCWEKDYCRDGREVCRTYMIRSNILPNASSVVFRKAAYQAVGGADDSMRLNGDWKLWASLMMEGEVAYISEPLNYYRFHNSAVRYTLDMARTVIPEWSAVARWIETRVDPPREVLLKAYRERAEYWVPALMSTHVPFRSKRSVFRAVRGMDPHPLRRFIRPAFRMLRLKFLRHWRQLTSSNKAPFLSGVHSTSQNAVSASESSRYEQKGEEKANRYTKQQSAGVK